MSHFWTSVTPFEVKLDLEMLRLGGGQSVENYSWLLQLVIGWLIIDTEGNGGKISVDGEDEDMEKEKCRDGDL